MYKIIQSGRFQTFIGHKSFSSKEIFLGTHNVQNRGKQVKVGRKGRGDLRMPPKHSLKDTELSQLLWKQAQREGPWPRSHAK